MENKENSGDSANSTSSEELFNKKDKNAFDKAILTSENKTDEYESGTQDLSLRLELDESGSLRETQDEYRMFSRIESSDEKKHVSSRDKETQEFQMSRSMDGPQSSPFTRNNKPTYKSEKDSDVNSERENKDHTDLKPRSSTKRHLDSQGKL